MPFEKGIKDYKLNMKDSTVLISFRTDKNSVEALRAAIERHDVKVVGICDKDGKLMKCDKTHKCCKEGNKEACKGNCGEKHDCSGTCGQSCGEKKCDGKCGDNCCSKTGKTDECCKNKKK